MSFCHNQFCFTVCLGTSCSPSLAQSTWHAYLGQEAWSSYGICSYQPMRYFYFIIIFTIINLSLCFQLWSCRALWDCTNTAQLKDLIQVKLTRYLSITSSLTSSKLVTTVSLLNLLAMLLKIHVHVPTCSAHRQKQETVLVLNCVISCACVVLISPFKILEPSN